MLPLKVDPQAFLPDSAFLLQVDKTMAQDAQRNEILFSVVAESAARTDMVHL
jgi:hypothetical protein